MVERVGQPHRAGERDVEVARVAQLGNVSSSNDVVAATCHPSGSKNRLSRSTEPLHGTAGIRISRGSSDAASSGRASQRPAIAVRKTFAIATASMLEAAEGRALTY